jgi:hypothetical protein
MSPTVNKAKMDIVGVSLVVVVDSSKRRHPESTEWSIELGRGRVKSCTGELDSSPRGIKYQRTITARVGT